MKRIGIITTGGDAPGMNAAIRSCVRKALQAGVEVYGIKKGWSGLVNGEIEPLTSRSVSGIINQGGTILKTLRYPKFCEQAERKKAALTFRTNFLEALLVIGGDGSARAACTLYKEEGIPVNLIPASIDNDLFGTEYTIGYDTAVNTAVEAIDRIRDTATSHERIFVIEVMGREKGFLALEVGLACGAEIILLPEIPVNWHNIVDCLAEGRKKGKVSSIIVVAEGAGKAEEVRAKIKDFLPESEIRCSVLGYIQRGGRPSAFSRNLATRFGYYAVELLLKNEFGKMVAWQKGRLTCVDLEIVVNHTKKIELKDLEIVEAMAL